MQSRRRLRLAPSGRGRRGPLRVPLRLLAVDGAGEGEGAEVLRDADDLVEVVVHRRQLGHLCQQSCRVPHSESFISKDSPSMHMYLVFQCGLLSFNAPELLLPDFGHNLFLIL